MPKKGGNTRPARNGGGAAPVQQSSSSHAQGRASPSAAHPGTWVCVHCQMVHKPEHTRCHPCNLDKRQACNRFAKSPTKSLVHGAGSPSPSPSADRRAPLPQSAPAQPLSPPVTGKRGKRWGAGKSKPNSPDPSPTPVPVDQALSSLATAKLPERVQTLVAEAQRQFELTKPLPVRIKALRAELESLQATHARKQKAAEKRRAQADNLSLGAQTALQQATAAEAALAQLEKEYAASKPFSSVGTAATDSLAQARAHGARAMELLLQQGITSQHPDFDAKLQAMVDEQECLRHKEAAAAAAAAARAASPFAAGAAPSAPPQPTAMDLASGVDADADDDSSGPDPAATPTPEALEVISRNWGTTVPADVILAIARNTELRRALRPRRRALGQSAKRQCTQRAYLPTDDDFDG